jgi:hypothetical protein
MAHVKPISSAPPIDNKSLGLHSPRESTLIYDGHLIRVYDEALALYLMLRTYREGCAELGV